MINLIAQDIRQRNGDIESTPLLSSAEVAKCLQKIDELKSYWRQQNWEAPYDGYDLPFYTLGAVNYADRVLVDKNYFELTKKFNPLLKEAFAIIYERMIYYLSDRLQANVILNQRGFAWPGFHIILAHKVFSRSPRVFHFDLNHISLPWPQDADLDQSIDFTMPLELPESGGGVDYLDIFRDDHMKNGGAASGHLRFREEAKNIKTYDYEPGHFVVHLGQKAHRIRPWSQNFKSSDRRITFQGHAVFCDGSWELFW